MDDAIAIKEEPIVFHIGCVKAETIKQVSADENSFDVQNVLELRTSSQRREDSTVSGGNEGISGFSGTTFCPNKIGKKFVCYYCGFISDWRRLFVKHVYDHLGSFVCEFCNYVTMIPDNLNRHRKIHKGEEHYKYIVRRSKSNTKDNLTRYQKIHDGVKLFGCIVCDYKCYTSHSLKLHTRSHNGEKPYECKLCDFRCALSSNLRKHEKIHTGEKPYCCSLCDFKTRRQSYLNQQHMRTHSGEKPYGCTFCSFKYTTASSLKRHLKTHS